jgi:hypothetical protein
MSKKKTVIINLRIDQEDHNIISDIAHKEARPINSHYRMIAGKWINENTNFESAFIQKESDNVNATNSIEDNKDLLIPITLRLGKHDYELICGFAKNEARSVNGQIRYILGNYIKSVGLQSDVFDDIEDEKPIRVDYNINRGEEIF